MALATPMTVVADPTHSTMQGAMGATEQRGCDSEAIPHGELNNLSYSQGELPP
ncbi:MAG: hypothetical protein ABIQ44_12800 [Chloroflexia bacterium]